MQDNPVGGRTTDARDRAVEFAVFTRVIGPHPTHLTLEELLLDMGAEDEGRTREAIVRAVRDITGAGLLRRVGEAIVPTLAALRAEEILDGLVWGGLVCQFVT